MHLVGEGGDVVAGAPPAYLLDLATRRDIPRLWRHCVRWARTRNCAPMSLFTRALSHSDRRRALTGLAEHLDRGQPVAPVNWERDNVAHWSTPHADWLTARARRTLAGHALAVADGLADDDAPGDVVTLGRLRLQTLTQRTIRAAGAELGVRVHAPYLDTAVVRACLSLTAARRASVTTPKPLLRAALTGLVPDEVLSRPTKGAYTADAYEGIRRAAPALTRLLDNPATADVGLVEPEPVRRVLAAAVRGLPTPWGALNQWIALEVWLRDRA
jgi:asparagine synthase (glutamine-hydrolysing)